MSPHYGWSGPGEMREMDNERSRTPEITAPTAPIKNEADRRIVCTAHGCGRKFKTAAITARHFNATHDDLKKDRDSWREYVEEVWE